MAVLRKRERRPDPFEANPEERAHGQRRPRRGGRTRRTGTALVIVLALVGAFAIVRTATAPPGVGRFDSPTGRAEYASAYDEAMATLPPPDRALDVRTSYGVVRVCEWLPTDPARTQEPPIVLMPGRASGMPMWGENLPHLVGEHRILAFDLLGDAGMSVQSVPMATIDDATTWLHELLTEVAPEGVHLVGHSFGGGYAAQYALAHPEHVRTLSLIEPVFTLAAPPAGMMAWAVLASLPGLPQSIRDRALAEIDGSGEALDDTDPTTRMIRAGTEHYRASLPQPAVMDADELASLSMPVYIALADHRSLAGGEAAEEAARGLPDGTVEVWPDSTHSLPMQHAGALDRRILERIDEAEKS